MFAKFCVSPSSEELGTGNGERGMGNGEQFEVKVKGEGEQG